jgi:hypothetical protein
MLATVDRLRCLARMALVPLSLAGPASAATLYNAALGSTPAAQGWTTLSVGAAAFQAVTVGAPPAYTLVTTGTGVSYFGNALLSGLALNTATGFDLSFQLKVVSETHDSVNRAGYSVVVVGADPSKAVELSFWTGNVWVPDYNAADPDRFVHGADAAFNTTGAFHTYLLSVRNQQYTLSADGTPLLSGALHDYTAGGAPYTQPNFLFFGDDSSRGTSATELAFVTLVPVPEPASAAMLVVGLAALAWRRRSKHLESPGNTSRPRIRGSQAAVGS